MFDSFNQLPVSGGTLMAGALYVGASMFVTGPLVGERVIAKSGWAQTCRSELHADIETRRTPPREMPSLDCRSIAGAFLPQLNELCDYYGNFDFGGLASSVIQAKERAKREMEDRRLARAAAQSGSRCACAAALVSQDSAWAIHAGSLRLITPPAIKQLNAELLQALHTPRCAEKE